MMYFFCQDCGHFEVIARESMIMSKCFRCDSANVSIKSDEQLAVFPICKDCTHYKKPWNKPPVCTVYSKREVVTGKVEHTRFCVSERGQYGTCGVSGNLYSKRK